MMSDLVDPEKIESIMGYPRRRYLHLARVVDDKVYIMHSKACIEHNKDLRECDYSKAMDRGTVGKATGKAQSAGIINGYLLLSSDWEEILKSYEEIFEISE